MTNLNPVPNSRWREGWRGAAAVAAVVLPLFGAGFGTAKLFSNSESRPPAPPATLAHTVVAGVGNPALVDNGDKLTITLRAVSRNAASGRWYATASFSSKSKPETQVPLFYIGDRIPYNGYDVQLLEAWVDPLNVGLARFGLNKLP